MKSHTRTKPEVRVAEAATTAILRPPLVWSSVPAGFPSPADDFVEDRIDLNQRLIQHPAATFFVRVAGYSMTGAGIQNGDLLIVDRALEAHNDSIVIAILDGEFTVKRFRKTGTGIELLPENGRFQSITITPDRSFEVWGVVTYVIHQATTPA